MPVHQDCKPKAVRVTSQSGTWLLPQLWEPGKAICPRPGPHSAQGEERCFGDLQGAVALLAEKTPSLLGSISLWRLSQAPASLCWLGASFLRMASLDVQNSNVS